jgi:hypothetical protein
MFTGIKCWFRAASKGEQLSIHMCYELELVVAITIPTQARNTTSQCQKRSSCKRQRVAAAYVQASFEHTIFNIYGCIVVP